MKQKKLDEIIERHGKWVLGKEDGVFADLSGVDLEGLDLKGANLNGANLKYAKLGWANLRDADLRGADLKEVDLKGAKLRCAKLIGVDLRGAYLCRANLSEADLRLANLKGATISWANLREANLREANLRDADLRGANLRDVDLRSADLYGVIIDKYMYQITGCGSFSTTVTYDVLNNQIIWGCWICDDGNTLENFKKMIEDVYGENGSNHDKKYYQEYVGAVKFFKAMKKLKDEKEGELDWD